jgi:integrase/recombinase XerD
MRISVTGEITVLNKITLIQALELFLEERTRRNYSPKTIRLYRHYTEKFYSWLDAKTDFDLSSITLSTLLDYRKHLDNGRSRNGAAYSKSTKDNSIKTLRQFFPFLKKQGMIFLDPTQGLPPIRSRNRFPRSIMTRSEVETLLAQPNARTLIGFRDRAIMETRTQVIEGEGVTS